MSESFGREATNERKKGKMCRGAMSRSIGEKFFSYHKKDSLFGVSHTYGSVVDLHDLQSKHTRKITCAAHSW
jgi:hypothetical protein